MSLTGILAGGLFDLLGTQSAQSSAASNQNGTTVQNEFQQLGQDLQSGNLSAARQDFATVEQGVRQRTSQILHHHHHFSGGGATNSTSTAQDFGELAQALQSGNLAAAQTAFAALQQAIGEPSSAASLSGAASSSQAAASNAVNFLA